MASDSKFTQADIETVQGILKQINDRNSRSSVPPSSTNDKNSDSSSSSFDFLNGLTRPPKGTKIFTYRKQFNKDGTDPNAKDPKKGAGIKSDVVAEAKMSPQLMFKMKKLARLNLLGAHASTEGPLGYANKPTTSTAVIPKSSLAPEICHEKDTLPEWDKRGPAPDDVIFSTLDANYERVRSATNITSEARIKNLISSLRQLLTEMNVPMSEFLQYFETYLNRLIMDKSWISITPSTALFMAVSSESDSSGSKSRIPGAWFKCVKCKFCYPPGRFSCIMCSTTFQSVVDVFEHNYRSHGKLIMQRFQCELCFTDFGANPASLRAHYYAAHFCRNTHIECSYGCRDLIVDEGTNTLNEHLYNEHICRICDDNFSTTLIDHQKQFHSWTAASNSGESNPILSGLTLRNEYREVKQQMYFQAPDVHKSAVRSTSRGRHKERSKSRSRRRSRSRSRRRSRSRSRRRSRSKDRHRKRRGSRSPDRRSKTGDSRRSESRDRSSKRSRSRDRRSRSSSRRSRSRRDKSRSGSRSNGRSQSHVELPNQGKVYSRVSRSRSPERMTRQVRRVSQPEVKSEGESMGSDRERDRKPPLIKIEDDESIQVSLEKLPISSDSAIEDHHSLEAEKGRISLERPKDFMHVRSVSTRDSPKNKRSSSVPPRKEEVYRLPHIMPSEKREWLKCSDCPLEMPPPGTYVCNNCETDFEMPNALYRHVKNRHNLRVPKNFDCEYCPEIFFSVESWDDHVNVKHICGVHDADKDEVEVATDCDKFTALAKCSATPSGKVNKNVKLNYCTQCEYSEWKGLVSSEPKTGVPVKQHKECVVPECPLLFHSEQAARNHLLNDKRCASKSSYPILYKMEIVNRVSAFQNYQNFSDIIPEKPKPASENSEPIKSE